MYMNEPKIDRDGLEEESEEMIEELSGNRGERSEEK